MDWIADIANKLKDPALLGWAVCTVVLAKLLFIREKLLQEMAQKMSISNELLARMAAILDILKDRRS